jgi:hypothetical protein
MLVINRYPGQGFIIRPQPNLDPNTPISELFANGPIRIGVTAVKGNQICLGISAHGGFCILRDELKPLSPPSLLAEDTRLALALKLRILMHVNQQTSRSLAEATGLPIERVMLAECGAGVAELDDLDKLARVLNVNVVELFRPPGRTPEERLILAILDKKYE